VSLSRSIFRAVLGSTILLVCLVFLGWLFHAEMDRTTKRLGFSLARSQEVLRTCNADAGLDLRDALLVYLAIEDYFRPAEIRRLEFWLAAGAVQIPVTIVKTLGIGQISKQTFVSTRDAVRSDADSTQDWIKSARDDCQNVTILQAYAKNNQIECNESGLPCILYLTCFWHAGRRDSCLRRYQDRGYAEDVAASYSRILQPQRSTSNWQQD
jgi:hypothetical protein